VRLLAVKDPVVTDLEKEGGEHKKVRGTKRTKRKSRNLVISVGLPGRTVT